MPAQQRRSCRGTLLIAIGVIQIVAVSCSPLSALQGPSVANCNVPGFTFRPNVVPSPVQTTPNNGPIQFYTLPHTPKKDSSGGVNNAIPPPQDNLPATVAACEADAACAMFTSDGYIIAAYRHTDPQKTRIGSEADIVRWQPMHYCDWACCGTWVADGLIAELLQPVPNTPGSNNVRSGLISQMPRDSVLVYRLDPELRTTACVGKAPPGNNRGRSGWIRGTAPQPGGPGCPKRCLTACCKQLASGNENMAVFFFAQCSGPACAGCELFTDVVAGQVIANVLMRQYVRERSKGPAALSASAGAAGVSKCRKPSGSAATTGSGELC